MTQEETVTVRFWVICGKHTPDGLMKRFEYLEQAPASLCKPHSDGEPGLDPDVTGVFLATLIERHHDEILCNRAWQCVTCGKPAREILHFAVSLLSPNADRVMAEFRPAVIDNAAPVCISGGACDRNAEKIVNEFAESVLVQKPWQRFEASKTCDKCGKKTGIKLCGGCKLHA